MTTMQNANPSTQTRTMTEHVGKGIVRNWELYQIHCEIETPYQSMVIGESAQGTSLFCNEERQSTVLTQAIYHEGQLIPALLMCPKPERVLILGSSEGVISYMAAQYGAKEIVHVDIDEECVRACASFLPYGYSVKDVDAVQLMGAKFKMYFGDGYAFLKDQPDASFDIVVVDLPDEDASGDQHNRLYSTDFLEEIACKLTPQGCIISQAGNPAYWRNDTLRLSLQRFKHIFENTAYFEMEEHDWAWVLGSKLPVRDVCETMIENLSKLNHIPEFIDVVSIPKATTIPISIRKSLQKSRD